MIIELFKAFKDAYIKIYAEKIAAKKYIKEIKNLRKEWEDRANDITSVERILQNNWRFLPINQRKDYIQKTIDLIHYGFDVEYHDDGTRTYNGGYNNGLRYIYNDIFLIVRGYLNEMKYSYKHNEYQDVISTYRECINKINEKLEMYHIINNIKDNE